MAQLTFLRRFWKKIEGEAKWDAVCQFADWLWNLAGWIKAIILAGGAGVTFLGSMLDAPVAFVVCFLLSVLAISATVFLLLKWNADKRSPKVTDAQSPPKPGNDGKLGEEDVIAKVRDAYIALARELPPDQSDEYKRLEMVRKAGLLELKDIPDGIGRLEDALKLKGESPPLSLDWDFNKVFPAVEYAVANRLTFSRELFPKWLDLELYGHLKGRPMPPPWPALEDSTEQAINDWARFTQSRPAQTSP